MPDMDHFLGLGVNFFHWRRGPHPRRVLTLMLALGFQCLALAWPQALMPPAPSAPVISK